MSGSVLKVCVDYRVTVNVGLYHYRMYSYTFCHFKNRCHYRMYSHTFCHFKNRCKCLQQSELELHLPKVQYALYVRYRPALALQAQFFMPAVISIIVLANIQFGIEKSKMTTPVPAKPKTANFPCLLFTK